MKCEKPQCLSLLHRVVEVDAKFHASFAVPILFPFAPPARIQSEIELWKFLDEQLEHELFDEALPKCGAEYVVIGRAYAPGGLACEQTQVSLQIGELSKQLSVHGDRDQLDGPAQPFTSMPLSWARGLGRVPNIRDPRGQAEPAGCAPLPAAMRSGFTGSYDREWLETGFPGLPRDFDWQHFNVAPPDQRQHQPFRGDELLRFENVHAARPILEGRLPGVRARCFIQRTERDAPLEEVPLALDTLWLFPNEGQGVLAFHGHTRVLEDDAADIGLVLLACETLDDTRSIEHYRAALARRQDPEDGLLATLSDDDLAPRERHLPALRAGAGLPPTAASAERPSGRDIQLRRLQRRADRLRARVRADCAVLGLEAERYMPVRAAVDRSFKLDDLPQRLRLARADVEWMQARAEETRDRELERLEQICTRTGLPWDAVVGGPRGGPPTFSAAGRLEELQRLADQSRRQGVETSLIERYLADPALRARLIQAEDSLREAYRSSAHHRPPSAALALVQRARLRELVASAQRNQLSMRGWDLTGADLRGLSLREAQFAGAWLEGADLAGCDLSGSDLSEAVLARADLSGASLLGANLRRANLGGARMSNARLGPAPDTGQPVDASDAIFAGADLRAADLRAAQLHGADFVQAQLFRASFAEAQLRDFNFIDCDLSQVSFEAADLTRSNFIHARLDGAVFRGAQLEQASWLGCEGSGVTFSGADMRRAVFALGCRLGGSDFSGADLSRLNARDQDLSGARFSHARLDGADLSGCELQAAVFDAASAIEARFERARLVAASFSAANLRSASLQKALLTEARFQGSNLFRTDFGRAQLSASDMSGAALIQRAKFLPRARHEAE